MNVCYGVGDYDYMMKLEAHAELYQRWLDDMPTPVERHLIAHSEFFFVHGGQHFDLGGNDSLPAAEYLRDELLVFPGSTSKVLGYRMRLSAAHAGPPIEVYMINPRDEPDEEGGRWLCWDDLVWADDRTKFDVDWLLDCYTDAPRDELRECARNWS